jgi:predicted DNA-binding transcriptional regulator YafY
MRERIPPSVGRLEAVNEARCVLETGAQRPDVLAYHVALLGVDFVVLEPEALRMQMRAMSRRLRKASTAGHSASARLGRPRRRAHD